MFRLYNVNDPKKLAKLAAECKGNVEDSTEMKLSI